MSNSNEGVLRGALPPMPDQTPDPNLTEHDDFHRRSLLPAGSPLCARCARETVQPQASDRTAIYAYPGDSVEGFPFRATHWFYQLGDQWMAVQGENADDWFADAIADGSPLPMQRTYPIERIPTYGTLIWRDHDGSEHKGDATIFGRVLRARMSH